MPLTAVCENSKTIRSLDLSTICPRLLAGHPCSYCYVNTARKSGFNAKQMALRVPYRGEILRLRQTTIDRLNAVGGLRIFSFGDYMPWMDDELKHVIADAERRGLKLKAITKVPLFVKKYAAAMNVINVSVDSLGSGVPRRVAEELREHYNSVFIRAAIMSRQDLETLAWADIYTLNHAANGFHVFRHNERDEIAAAYPGRVCCVTGSCVGCPIRCGEVWLEKGGENRAVA